MMITVARFRHAFHQLLGTPHIRTGGVHKPVAVAGQSLHHVFGDAVRSEDHRMVAKREWVFADVYPLALELINDDGIVDKLSHRADGLSN